MTVTCDTCQHLNCWVIKGYHGYKPCNMDLGDLKLNCYKILT